MHKPTKTEITEFLTRGVEEVIDAKEFEKLLLSGKRITAYLGIDPTGSDIHLGHSILLRKMRKLQDWGHEVILLIGDFTAMIGDPTGRDAARQPLTTEQVLENAKDYQKQAASILDFDGENPVIIKYNSQWLSGLNFGSIVDLAANFTVQQMLERDMFQRRISEGKPISLHEFLYPLMQSYDSVHMGVDLEFGGTDQLFNMLVGRTLMRKLKNKEKHVLAVTLLEGSDGRKMSKSFQNHIPIRSESKDMYGKIMSIKDELIVRYFWLTTNLSKEKIDEMEKEVKSGGNPRDFKMALGREIVTMYHGEAAAKEAEAAFVSQFQKGALPDEMPEIKVSKKSLLLVDLLVEADLVKSKSDAKRLIKEGAVKLNGEAIKEMDAEVTLKSGDVLQKGKREFRKILV
jgi:tyrosyl-tRNA synthetase